MSKTKQQIRQDLDAIVGAHPQAIGAAGPLDLDKLSEGIHELLSTGAINPQLLSILKMALGVLSFLPIPMAPLLAKILEYILQELQNMP